VTPTATDTLAPQPTDDESAELAAPRSARAPRAGGSVRGLWHDALIFTGRNLEHIRQIPEKLLDVTLQPLMFVLLFAYVFGGAISVGQGSSYREYIVAGILVQTIAFGLMGPGVSIATDLTEGVVDRFRTLPVHRYAYLVGHYVAELLGLVLATVLLLVSGTIVGWRVHEDLLHVLGAVGLILLFASAMIWLGTWIGLLVRTSDAVQGVAFTIVFPLTFLSNAFVPLNTLPKFLQWVAAWNPFTAIVGAVRELFGNPASPVTRHAWPIDHPVAAALITTLLILGASVAGSFHRYRTRTAD
jgi:ABC transporter DrrB family efflux protein